MFAIRSSLRTLPVIPVNTYLKVFDFMIKLILLYGSEVWGPYEIKANTNSTLNSLLINYKNPGQNPTGQNPTLTKPHQLFSVKDKTPLFSFSWNDNINDH